MNYHIVITDPFYETLDSPQAKDFYLKALEVRARGYNNSYNEIIYPFGVEDCASLNVLICDKESMEVAACFKLITNKICVEYSLDLPILHNLTGRDTPKNLYLEVEEEIYKKESMGMNVGYIGAFTFNPKFKNSREAIIIKKLLTTSIVNIKKDMGLDEIFVTGVIFNSAFRYIENLGYQKVVQEPIYLESLKTTAFLYSCKESSKTAKRTTECYQHYWEKKLYLSGFNKRLEFRNQSHIRSNHDRRKYNVSREPEQECQ